jgi:hypothetical protein
MLHRLKTETIPQTARAATIEIKFKADKSQEKKKKKKEQIYATISCIKNSISTHLVHVNNNVNRLQA